jgi:hypothetical protein
MDTTNGNHAMVRELVWRHCHFVDCGQHLAALSAADLLEVPAFKAANDAGNALSVFIRGSQKRTDALARLTPLRPMKQCKTRFAFAFAQFQRLHALSPHLATMHTKVMNNEPLFNGEEGVDPAKTVATYKALYAAYLPTLPVVEAMAGIADRFLGVIARLGCDDEYTSSIAQEAFQALFSLGGGADGGFKAPRCAGNWTGAAKLSACSHGLACLHHQCDQGLPQAPLLP